MSFLLRLSRAIDALNERVGHLVYWLILAAVLVSAGNAMVRYAFDMSSNGWLELQWYMFAIVIMFGASYTFKRNEHVRVEILYLMLSERGQLWLDMIGTLFFLIPACLLLAYLSWLRWPVKLLIPAGFLLLALQGVSEIIKRAAFLMGRIPDPLEKHDDPIAEKFLKGAVE